MLGEEEKTVNIFDCAIPVADFRCGCPEDSNGGHYVWRAEFFSPMPSVYLTREIASFHGDLAGTPGWEAVNLPEYKQRLDSALAANACLEEDLQVGAMFCARA